MNGNSVCDKCRTRFGYCLNLADFTYDYGRQSLGTSVFVLLFQRTTEGFQNDYQGIVSNRKVATF